ncbi:MAG: hypothetical protein U0289_06700 [Cyclobacteriaceae bacterium]
MSTRSHRNIFANFDEHRSIGSNFMEAFESGYIALHPFYRRVFQEDFDYRRRLKDSFNLIEPITWNKVMSELKFKDTSQLARAILRENTTEAKELNDYVEYRRLVFPVMVEDTIPEVILYKYLKYLLGHGIKEVTKGYSKHTSPPDDKRNKNLGFSESNIFEVIEYLEHGFVVETDFLNIVLLLPNHDCPYTLILGDKELVDSFVEGFSIEGFWVDRNTRFDWWAG